MLLTKLLDQTFGTRRKPVSKAPSLTTLRRRAARLGVTIDIERDAEGRCYWLKGTGWDDGNFCADRAEIASSLAQLQAERGL